MYIAVLGRQSKLSIAELEARFGSDSITPLQNVCLVEAETFDINSFGGTIKVARLIGEIDATNWNSISKQIKAHITYAQLFGEAIVKMSFGISVYGMNIQPRMITGLALEMKKILRASDQAKLRIVPNEASELSSAQVLHNKLTDPNYGAELIIVADKHRTLIGITTGIQNIDAYTKRDHGRPARDAKVGMLPPKLAQIMINLGTAKDNSKSVYDPFCGTGVVLQEAILMGHEAGGSDLEPRMVQYSQQNLDWLELKASLTVADAQEVELPQSFRDGAIVTEMYLGEPLHSPPISSKLRDLLTENYDLLHATLKNLSHQLSPNASLCIAVPAWKHNNQYVSVLDELMTVDDLKKLGYTYSSFQYIGSDELLYARPDQVVGRRLLSLRRNNE